MFKLLKNCLMAIQKQQKQAVILSKLMEPAPVARHPSSSPNPAKQPSQLVACQPTSSQPVVPELDVDIPSQSANVVLDDDDPDFLAKLSDEFCGQRLHCGTCVFFGHWFSVTTTDLSPSTNTGTCAVV